MPADRPDPEVAALARKILDNLIGALDDCDPELIEVVVTDAEANPRFPEALELVKDLLKRANDVAGGAP